MPDPDFPSLVDYPKDIPLSEIVGMVKLGVDWVRKDAIKDNAGRGLQIGWNLMGFAANKILPVDGPRVVTTLSAIDEKNIVDEIEARFCAVQGGNIVDLFTAENVQLLLAFAKMIVDLAFAVL